MAKQSIFMKLNKMHLTTYYRYICGGGAAIISPLLFTMPVLALFAIGVIGFVYFLHVAGSDNRDLTQKTKTKRVL